MPQLATGSAIVSRGRVKEADVVEIDRRRRDKWQHAIEPTGKVETPKLLIGSTQIVEEIRRNLKRSQVKSMEIPERILPVYQATIKAEWHIGQNACRPTKQGIPEVESRGAQC